MRIFQPDRFSTGDGFFNLIKTLKKHQTNASR